MSRPKLQDLTVNDCIVSSTPEEWATVQNIFLMNSYECLLPEDNSPDIFEDFPISKLTGVERDQYLNVSSPFAAAVRNARPICAAEFIAANVPPENSTGRAGGSWSGESVDTQNLPKLPENLETGTPFDEPETVRPVEGYSKEILEQIRKRHECRTPYVASDRTPLVQGSANGTDLEQLQDEIELAVRKDTTQQSHLFFEPKQLEDAMASVNFLHLRELLAQRFPLMNSVPADTTDNKNEPSVHSSNVM